MSLADQVAGIAPEFAHLREQNASDDEFVLAVVRSLRAYGREAMRERNAEMNLSTRLFTENRALRLALGSRIIARN